MSSTPTKPTTNTTKPNRHRLAAILQERIRNGQFKPGERFLSVRQIADDYQVSPATAHQGMKILVDEHWLETHARSGAVVGPAASNVDGSIAPMDTIQVVTGKPSSVDGVLLGPGVCEGLISVWPNASIHLSILPIDEDPLPFIDRLLVPPNNRFRLVGAVITRCPRVVKQRFMKCDFPVVVHGHVDDDIELPFVDRDQFSIGKTLADHLLSRGHQRLGLLIHNNWMPGDNQFLFGIQRAMAEQNISADRLRIHSVNSEAGSFRVSFDALRTGPDSASALICRSDRMALECLAAAKAAQLRVPQDLAIVSAGLDTAALTKARPTITGMSNDGEAIGHLMGELLAKLSRGQPAQRTHVELPSELIHRESS